MNEGHKDDASLAMVTVAIPTFNRLTLLQRAVASALAQNYQNLEIIISDNASSDGTTEYLRSLDDVRLRIICGQTNVGMVSNWDRCLASARGDYFLLMSDDDALLECSAVEKLVSGFLNNRGEAIGAVFSDVMLERTQKNIVEKTSSDKTLFSAEEIVIDFFMNKVAIFPCATLLRTKDLRDLGGYSSFGAKLAVDACAWISLTLKYGQIFRINEPLVLYRIHHSLSSSSIDTWSDDFTVMQALVEKYRAKVSLQGYKKMQRAMNSAWCRIPLGYISRKLREDSRYGFLLALRDIFLFRKRIFTISNANFVLSKLFRI